MSRRPPSSRRTKQRKEKRNPALVSGEPHEVKPRRAGRTAKRRGSVVPAPEPTSLEPRANLEPASTESPADVERAGTESRANVEVVAHASAHDTAEEAFFAHGDEASVPPSAIDLHEHEVATEEPRRPITPELLARRARLRRVVAGIVGAAAFMSTLVAGRLLFAPRRGDSMADTGPNLAHRIFPSVDVAATVAESPEKIAPAAAPVPEPAEPPKTATPVAEPTEPAKAVAPENALPSEPAVVAEPPTAASAQPPSPDVAPAGDKEAAEPDLATQKRMARALIVRGRLKEGIVAAQEVIARDPADADIYLVLGAGLQEAGRWAEAGATFARCARDATKGPVHECRALMRR
jgi:hypothetical protein